MSHLSDEAVEAAYGAMFDSGAPIDIAEWHIRAALEAALPHLEVWTHNAFIRSSDENLQLHDRIRELEDAARKAIAPCGSPNHSIGRNLLKALLAEESTND